jgi:KUP system potassium uptake protein
MDTSIATLPDVADKAAAPAERRSAITLVLTALGIVFGDLGTSPLYTYQTIVGAIGGHPSRDAAIGLLSLVVWALLVTISIKYCVFVMRADNHGEGGILALMSLVTGRDRPGRRAAVLVAMGLFGAALIYGDGVITPAISVLSALEGINVATDVFKPYVLPAALAVLVALFAAQIRGTASIGKVFGPIMLVWFITIGVLGLLGVIHRPEVFGALDPRYAIAFLAAHGLRSFIVLGGVFLAITGGEALYADMGSMGRAPILSAWYSLVLPALLLSYAGQTALLLENPSLDGNPFFKLAPGWAVIPLVVLATVATIIASQAIITGAFSLTRQAMQLGWFPGLRIRQTSGKEYGQIYVPFVNWTMMAGTLALTYGFGSSDRLAGAYGTAVSTTMLLTTGLLFDAMRRVWRWPTAVAIGVAGTFLVIDAAFFGSNLLKLRDGGWIPLVLGILIYFIMTTWRRGIEALGSRMSEGQQSGEAFLAALRDGAVPRVPGTAVFLSRSGMAIPPLMVRHVAQMKAIQQTLISLSIEFTETPRVTDAERIVVDHIADGLWHVTVRFGFIEVPSLVDALALAKDHGCPLNLDDAVCFAARDEVVRSKTRPRLSSLRRGLFGFMYRNAVRTPDRFDLPPDGFLEISRQIQL